MSTNPSWLPTLHMGYDSASATPTTSSVGSHHARLSGRKQKKRVSEAASSLLSLQRSVPSESDDTDTPSQPRLRSRSRSRSPIAGREAVEQTDPRATDVSVQTVLTKDTIMCNGARQQDPARRSNVNERYVRCLYQGVVRRSNPEGNILHRCAKLGCPRHCIYSYRSTFDTDETRQVAATTTLPCQTAHELFVQRHSLRARTFDGKVSRYNNEEIDIRTAG